MQTTPQNFSFHYFYLNNLKFVGRNFLLSRNCMAKLYEKFQLRINYISFTTSVEVTFIFFHKKLFGYIFLTKKLIYFLTEIHFKLHTPNKIKCEIFHKEKIASGSPQKNILGIYLFRNFFSSR